MSDAEIRAEVERICRVADMLCTGHAVQRDRYARRALVLDLSLFAASTWLVSLSFVDPTLQARLTPGSIDPPIWIGIMGVVTFFASIVQLYVSWKEKSTAHGRSLEIYSEIKREAKFLQTEPVISAASLRSLVDRNTFASTGAVATPEALFLDMKKAYKTKVAISKHLDVYPSASITLTRIRLWWRSNVSGKAGL